MNKVWEWFRKYVTIHNFLLCGIGFLFILFISVMLSSYVECILMDYTGIENNKPELLKFIGWGIGGFIATLGAIALLQRTIALDEQNKISEKGHIHERFKAATEHLGNERTSVRIAAFYEFYRLAEIEPDLRQTIFDILCAHLRETTKAEDCTQKSDITKSKEIKPTEEIQSLLDILFKNNVIFDGMSANIKRAILHGANLRRANLYKAEMQRAKLQKAYMPKANLHKAKLKKADIQGANLQEVNLQGANLQDANLHKTKLQKANLQNADLLAAKISKQTKMPDGWENMVIKDENGKTGVLLVDDEENVIERL